MSLLWSSFAFAGPACPTSDLAAARQAIAAAELTRSKEGSTVAQFSDAVAAAVSAATCVDVELQAPEIGRLHLLVGFDHLANGRDAEATAAFQSATRAAPHLTIDAFTRAAPGEPSRWLLEEAFKATAVDRFDLVVPEVRRGVVLVDGLPLGAMPSRRPAFVSWVVDGAVREAVYVRPGDPLPSWPSPSATRSAVFWAVEAPALASLVAGVVVLVVAQVQYVDACPERVCTTDTFDQAFVRPQRVGLILTAAGASGAAGAALVYAVR